MDSLGVGATVVLNSGRFYLLFGLFFPCFFTDKMPQGQQFPVGEVFKGGLPILTLRPSRTIMEKASWLVTMAEARKSGAMPLASTLAP